MDSNNISVSMCVYGGDNAVYFDCAIESIINQTLKPKEIVLTVDGPIPDEIKNVITKYRTQLEDSSIILKVIHLKQNKGHGEARRICLQNCESEIVALMDADDLSEPFRFQKQIDYFNSHPDASVVGGQITEFISGKNPKDISNTAGVRTVPENDDKIKKYMKKRCPMNQVTVMFKKKDLDEVGGYIDWYCEEDYYLWIRLYLAGKIFGNVPDNLVNVRVGDEMYQRRGGVRYFQSEYRLQLFMLKNNIINPPEFIENVSMRFILQILLPNKMRGWVYKRFARN